jgi:hypothetical protein
MMNVLDHQIHSLQQSTKSIHPWFVVHDSAAFARQSKANMVEHPHVKSRMIEHATQGLCDPISIQKSMGQNNGLSSIPAVTKPMHNKIGVMSFGVFVNGEVFSGLNVSGDQGFANIKGIKGIKGKSIGLADQAEKKAKAETENKAQIQNARKLQKSSHMPPGQKNGCAM